ncbi:ferredoxin family protein [Smaragdicoccus niigatensis]|uniref:4Fe-4S dicluster domain-containing protein n=1 Tax=Smaragdicoccus niigatensis TaxID=359359 RepID=UPI000374ABD6|nr:4Fe-4S binding protein [Smaragdicoccus niigatensis]
MAFVIAAPCIADYSCVEACPVDCISPGPDDPGFDKAEQLFIDPQNCIDCGVCVDVCPVDAVYEADLLPPKWAHYEQINAQYFEELS